VWAKVKGTINHRERVYEQLVKEFRGDKDWFFLFFVIVPGEEALHPYRKIAEAIPWMSKDIEAEMAQPAYRDAGGAFLKVLWSQHWADKNWWEVWRALGSEQYL
jgi:hypothetical protein